MISKRESIISAFVERVQTIRLANGCHTDIGQNVGRAIRVIDQNDLPAAVIWPLPETAERSNYGTYNKTMDIRIEGFSTFRQDDESMDGASLMSEKMLADMLNAFGGYQIAYADDFAYVAGGTENYPEPGESKVGVSAVFRVTYKTALNRADI